MKVFGTNGIDQSRQNIVIVIACNSVSMDSGARQLCQPGFERPSGLEKTVGVVDDVAVQCDEVNLFLNR
jgi:hypothetical protein